MTDYKSYYYVARRGRSFEIYSTRNNDWLHILETLIRRFSSFEDALKYKEDLEMRLKDEKKQTRA